MNQIKSPLIRSISKMLLFCLGTLSLYSQQTVKTETTKEEDVIVLPIFNVEGKSVNKGYQSTDIFGANRMVVPIDKMDGSAFVINSQMIKDLSPRYLTDVAKYVAGVEQPRFYSAWDNIVIRGNNSGTNLIDGFSLRGYTEFLPMVLIEQVEVIKGAQGVLYGSVSGGGVINRVTKQPRDKFSGEITANLGTYGYYSRSIDLTGPVANTNDKLSYRAISSFSKGGGRQDNLMTESPEMVQFGSLRYALPGGGNVTASLSYVQREWSPASEVTGGDSVTGLVDPAYHKKHSYYESLLISSEDYRFTVIGEKMIGPVASRFAYYHADNPWEDDALFACCGNTVAPEPVFARYRKQSGTTDSFYYDGVWKFNLGDGVANIINFGLDRVTTDATAFQLANYGPQFDYGLFDRNNPPKGRVKINVSSPNNSVQSNQALTTSSTGEYLNWRVSFLQDRFSAIAGIRHINYMAKTKNFLGASRPEKTGSRDLKRIGIVGEITPGLNVFAGFSETFNVNTGIGYIPPGSQITASNYLPDPGSKSKEFGLHYSMKDQRFNFSTSYYSLSQTGRVGGGTSSFEPIRILPDNTNTGVEFQLTAAPTDNLFLVASATKAKINDFLANGSIGARSADLSETIYNAFAKYTFLEGDAKGFGIGLGMNHYGDKRPSSIPSGSAGALPNYMVPAVTTLDLALSYERGNWGYSLNVVNLTDKIYITRFGGSLLALWVNSGRVATIRARYKW